MSKIFVRERRKMVPGERKPRFRVVAVAGPDLKVRTKHIRKVELEVIAEATGAEVVFLPEDKGGKFGVKPE